MALKERYQNPVVGDNLNLRLFTYNSANLANLSSVDRIELYAIDDVDATEDQGLTKSRKEKRLVAEIAGNIATGTDVGSYLINVSLERDQFTIGKYIDVWHVHVNPDEPGLVIANCFEIYPDQWYTTPIPIVFDFNFNFQPNKIRHGAKQYLIIEIKPNVPKASDLERYYQNIAIVADLTVSIEQACGECVPKEQDLRMVVDDEPVDFREKRFGYYQLDTEDLECGIYYVTFKMCFGGNRYVSDRMPLQIFS